MSKEEQELFQSVRDYYSTEVAIREYAERAGERRLEAPEQAMVERFMTPPARVLDVGCGAGREAFALADMGYQVTGIDITPALIEQARALAWDLELPVDFPVCDGKSLAFPDDSFDYVLLITQMIHYVPLKANRAHLLREAGRVCKPQARILLTYHDWDIVKTHRLWGDGKKEEGSDQVAERFASLEPGDVFRSECQGQLSEVFGYGHNFTRDEMESEVLEAGLTIIERADFYSITGEPLEFWKPTQVLVLTK